MDSQIIYAKTASGEEAMHKRTRVMQRNVRMVLILVDGQSTVADLTLKTGNQKLTENAIRELEKAGFIAPVIEQDSLWAEGKKVAQEIREAAVSKARKLVPSGAKEAEPPEAKEEKPSWAKKASRPVEPSLSDTSISLHSAFASSKGDSSISQFSVAPIPPLQFGKAIDGQLSSVFSEPAPKNGVEELIVAPSQESKPSLLERLKVAVSAGKTKEEGSSEIKPLRRAQSRRMSLPALAASCALGLCVLALLIVFAFPFERYLPEVEKAFAKATGQPVKVGSLHVDLYPKPGLFLGNVRIGGEGHEVHIAKIGLRPLNTSVFSKATNFRSVELSGVSLSAESVVGMTEIFSALAKPDAGVSVESITFVETEVSFNGLGFNGMQGEVKLTEGRRFQSLAMSSVDRSLNIELKPQGSRLDVVLDGMNWRPAEKSPFLFTSANLKGRIEKNLMTIDEMELHLFDGVIKGSAVLGVDKQPYVTGRASFERVNVARLGNALGLGSQFSGDAFGLVAYAASNDSWSDVFSELVANGEFSVRRGSVQGVDLAEAVRRVSGTPVEGGKTAFEQLSGKLAWTPATYQFSGLLLDSGLMQAVGAVDVSRDLKINGKMELQMKGSANQMRVPIIIKGPLKAPMVQVGK